jgi:putative ABC transport system permease protein
MAEALTGTDAVVQGVVLGEPGGGPGDLGRSVRRTLMHFLTATSEHIQT